MKTAGVIYTGRLGDIILTLPLSKALSEKYKVLHYCHKEYVDIFKAVTYVNPKIVPTPDRANAYHDAVAQAKKECDEVYDRQIWPRLYNEYRSSKLKWMDFYYKGFPFVKSKKPVFDVEFDVSEHIKKNTLVVSCHAYSDGGGTDWKWIDSAINAITKKFSISEVVYLCSAKENSPLKVKHIKGLPLHLIPSILKRCKILLARNSSLACMAMGTNTPTFHIKALYNTKQDTHTAPNLVGVQHKSRFNDELLKLEKLCK